MKPCLDCGASKERPQAQRCNTCALAHKHVQEADWREQNRETIRAYAKQFYAEKNKVKLAEQRAADRLYALAYYGDSHCACCGETHVQFLVIDHIHGLGKQHRKEIHNNIYRWLRVHKYPDGFRVLCHNCNMSLGIYGFCPHKPDIPA